MTSAVTLLSNFERLEGFISTGREALQNNDIKKLFSSSFNIAIGLRNFGLRETYNDCFVYLEEMNSNKKDIETAGKSFLKLCLFVELSMTRILTEINPEEV